MNPFIRGVINISTCNIIEKAFATSRDFRNFFLEWDTIFLKNVQFDEFLLFFEPLCKAFFCYYILRFFPTIRKIIFHRYLRHVFTLFSSLYLTNE
jgi:hypothetical protein